MVLIYGGVMMLIQRNAFQDRNQRSCVQLSILVFVSERTQFCSFIQHLCIPFPFSLFYNGSFNFCYSLFCRVYLVIQPQSQQHAILRPPVNSLLTNIWQNCNKSYSHRTSPQGITPTARLPASTTIQGILGLAGSMFLSYLLPVVYHIFYLQA